MATMAYDGRARDNLELRMERNADQSGGRLVQNFQMPAL